MENVIARNSLRSRKAISSMLATLLLVVVAVAAIVVTYAWVMTYTNHLTGQAGVVPYPANVKRARYVGTTSSTMNNQTITPVSLNADSVQRITVNYSWQNCVSYYFKVLTSAGPSPAWAWQAPIS